MARTDPQVNLRMPAELKDRLDKRAQANKRSLTAEILARLENSFDNDPDQLDVSEANRIIEQLLWQLRQNRERLYEDTILSLAERDGLLFLAGAPIKDIRESDMWSNAINRTDSDENSNKIFRDYLYNNLFNSLDNVLDFMRNKGWVVIEPNFNDDENRSDKGSQT